MTCISVFSLFLHTHYALLDYQQSVMRAGGGSQAKKKKEVFDVNMPNLIIKVKLLMLLKAQELC